MGFIDLFKSRDKKELETHIVDLVHLAKADGHVDERETKIILAIAESQGLEFKDVRELMKNIPSKSTNPKNPRKKIEYLFDLYLVMNADRKMTENEFIFCLKIGKDMGINPDVTREIIEMMDDLILYELQRSKIIVQINDKYGDVL